MSPKGALERKRVNGEEFRATRERAGLSFREAAQILGRSKSSIYRWEHGAEIPSEDADRIRELADQADERKRQTENAAGSHAKVAVAGG